MLEEAEHHPTGGYGCPFSKVLSYASELFLMGVGALLGLNVAPTEEMVLIACKMTVWHAVALVTLSLALMHAFVYAVDFKSAEFLLSPETPWWSLFLRFTVAGYGVAIG